LINTVVDEIAKEERLFSLYYRSKKSYLFTRAEASYMIGEMDISPMKKTKTENLGIYLKQTTWKVEGGRTCEKRAKKSNLSLLSEYITTHVKRLEQLRFMKNILSVFVCAVFGSFWCF